MRGVAADLLRGGEMRAAQSGVTVPLGADEAQNVVGVGDLREVVGQSAGSDLGRAAERFDSCECHDDQAIRVDLR